MKEYKVRIYDKNGMLVNEVEYDTELECAKLCIDRLKLNYPAPTVWKLDKETKQYKRVMGY